MRDRGQGGNRRGGRGTIEKEEEWERKMRGMREEDGKRKE